VLTADLVKVRCRTGRLQPVWLKGAAAEAWMPMAAVLVEQFENGVGLPVSQLDEAVATCVGDGPDRVRAAGLVKLLKDRCEIEEAASSEAEDARALVFGHAAAVRRKLGLLESFDRDGSLRSCAERASSTPEKLEATLFSDLPGAQRVLSFDRIDPAALLQRYNLALAQGVLLRATRVRLQLAPAPAAQLRQLFRTIKFRRLMHQISGDAEAGWELVLDGPMSLFESTQRYGLQLAMLLPTIVTADRFVLNAEVLWGKGRVPMRFELSWRDGLVSTREAPQELEEVALLVRTFGKLQTEWRVLEESTVFGLGGKGVFVPDLAFEHGPTGRRVYLEVFGYWSREAVFKRLEALQEGFAQRVILAVSRKLRVSEEAAEGSFPGKIVVYSQSINAHAIREALDEVLAGAG
jgi:uncharacterized protein